MWLLRILVALGVAGGARVQLQREGPADERQQRGAIGGAHLHGPRVLPEAQAHGPRQDARARPRAQSRPHPPAHRGLPGCPASAA